MREDWWPRMVMLKILKQYYSATQDPRVIEVLTSYFQYQLQQLPEHPLDHWTFWDNRRGADNRMVVYWVYNVTGEPFMLDLGQQLHNHTFTYTGDLLKRYPAAITHISNLHPYRGKN